MNKRLVNVLLDEQRLERAADCVPMESRYRIWCVTRSPLEKESKRQMLRLKKKAESAGVVTQTEVRVGSIDTEILAAIKKFKADLVVMGTHGRHGIERWFMGSVAERMARRCPAPLRTIPPATKRTA